MRRTQITTPGVYEVALSRSGRGGRRIDAREIVYITDVELSEHYRDSDQYEVRFERALVKGIVSLRRMTRDVLRRATDAEATKHVDNRRMALKYGWVDERKDKTKIF